MQMTLGCFDQRTGPGACLARRSPLEMRGTWGCPLDVRVSAPARDRRAYGPRASNGDCRGAEKRGNQPATAVGDSEPPKDRLGCITGRPRRCVDALQQAVSGLVACVVRFAEKLSFVDYSVDGDRLTPPQWCLSLSTRIALAPVPTIVARVDTRRADSKLAQWLLGVRQATRQHDQPADWR